MIPAKAGTTNGLRFLMQFPSERGERTTDGEIFTKRSSSVPRSRVGLVCDKKTDPLGSESVLSFKMFGSDQSQSSLPPVWYSVTRVSKKFFSLAKSIVSLIHGNGLLLLY